MRSRNHENVCAAHQRNWKISTKSPVVLMSREKLRASKNQHDMYANVTHNCA